MDVSVADRQRRSIDRENQRSFVANSLPMLRRMSPKLYTECFVQPTLQYFLATLCDMRVEPQYRSRLGLRYPKTPEVSHLLSRLEREKTVNAGKCSTSPNAVVSALKEILSGFPGGVFVEISEEFYSISLQTPLEMAIVYLHGLLDTLPYFLRQFVYLICRSLRNLVHQASGSLTDSYTDLLLLFTPALFPSAVGYLERFLRAARLTLVMVDRCEQVFQPVVRFDQNGNLWPLLSDDDSFFCQVLASLQRLEASLDGDTTDENDSTSTDSKEDTFNSGATNLPLGSTNQFYQFTYVDIT